MIQESQNCSTLIGFVPRPSGPVGAIKSLTTVVIQEVKALIKKVASDDHAIACLKGVAYQKDKGLGFSNLNDVDVKNRVLTINKRKE
ncbi:hypothetical protein DKL61_11415 [Gammaproteobacteria bacterium ESL0073]|nr:hypothetical protein DKL61_11415 [Gammaproteobacteria bacterium ESL0073]